MPVGRLCYYLMMSLEYLSKKERVSKVKSAGCLFIPATRWHISNKAGFISYVKSFIVPATLCHENTDHRNYFP